MNAEDSLKRLLSLIDVDLQIDAHQIITRRAAARNLPLRQLGSQRHRDVSVRALEQREEVIAAIGLIRDNFWQWTHEELHSRLNSVQCNDMPEWALVLGRLKAVAAVRDEFPRLLAALRKNVEFYHFFLEVMTAGPREAAGMKEQTMRNLLGRQGGSYKRAARLIKQKFVKLYQLEPVWIDEIISYRNPKSIIGNLTWG